MRGIQLLTCCLLLGMAASTCDEDGSCDSEKDAVTLLQRTVKTHDTESDEAMEEEEEEKEAADQDETEEGQDLEEEDDEENGDERGLLSARRRGDNDGLFPYKQILEKVCKSCDSSSGALGGPWYGKIEKRCQDLLKGRRRVKNGDGYMYLPPGDRRRGACFHPTDNGPPTNGDRRRNKVKLEMNMWVDPNGHQPLCACMWKVLPYCEPGGDGYKGAYNGRRRKSPVKCIMNQMCQCSGMCSDFKKDTGKCDIVTGKMKEDSWDDTSGDDFLLQGDSEATRRAGQTNDANRSNSLDETLDESSSLDATLNDKTACPFS